MKHAHRSAAELASSAGSPLEGAALFSHLVSSVRDYAIFALDTKGHVLTWNVGAQRIKGYAAEEIIGKHFSIFYPAEDIENGKTTFELRVAAREGRFEDEGWRLRKDGTRFWANVIITALRDADGHLFGYAKVTRDLTERRAAQQRALEDAQRVAAAEASNQAKSEFLTMLSHELRTPLNAIAGYVQLLEVGIGGPIAAQQREYLERIRGSQQHLSGIINDLLNYSRIEAAKVSFSVGAVSIHETVERGLRMIEPQAKENELRLEHGPCDDRIVAKADDAKLEQVLLNLLTNAVKFTPAGGKITVRCDESAQRACITVTDTGPGIPVEHLDSIFEPFVQVGRKLNTVAEGVGLGLSISRELARGMGGDLTVESTPGEGSAFTVELPKI